jgi:Type II secretion system (T2SS), protein G
MKLERVIFYGLAAFFVFLLLAMLIPGHGHGEGIKKAMCRIELSDLRTALNAYRENYSSYPSGENSNVIRMLAGDNPQKIIFLNFRRTAEHPNEMVDPWETPYQIQFSQQTNFVLRSAGKDKIFGNADDFIFNSVSNDFVKP